MLAGKWRRISTRLIPTGFLIPAPCSLFSGLHSVHILNFVSNMLWYKTTDSLKFYGVGKRKE